MFHKRPRISNVPFIGVNGTIIPFVSQKIEQKVSPGPVKTFEAIIDNNTRIPPDSNFAVGTNHVMTTLNSQVRIQDLTGEVISTVTLDTFWTSLGHTNVFDPKILYDPFAQRFVITCMADGRLTTSAVLFAVSQSNDPTEGFYFWTFDADATNLDWCDFPSMGFNKTWIVINVNMFTIAADAFAKTKFWIIDKAKAYTNDVFTPTLKESGGAFTVVPALTLDNTQETLYMVDSSVSLTTVRVSTITGNLGAEVLTIGTATSSPAVSTWSFTGNEILPQLGDVRKIDSNDARMLSVVFRNSSIYCTHSVFFPAGGSPTRASIQWFNLQTNGTTNQHGLIDDATGTQMYAFPSIAVNKNLSILIGYSVFSPTIYMSAGYSYGVSNAGVVTLDDPYIYKDGEASYYKVYSGTVNRAGDFNASLVDPVDDTTFWTINEIAATPGFGFDRWSTWIAQVNPAITPVLTSTPTPTEVPPTETPVIPPLETPVLTEPNGLSTEEIVGIAVASAVLLAGIIIMILHFAFGII